MQRQGNFDIVRREVFFFDRQRAAVQRFRFGSVAARLPNRRQVVQIDSDFVMLFAINARENCERLFIQLFRFVIFFLPSSKAAKAAKSEANAG